MAEYRVRFTTGIEINVTVEAADEDEAADRAWELANEWANTITGHAPDRITADVSLDGIGADEVSRG